jgi:hypothetical protein
LQIETYKWQKTLPRLVFVALFINFTLVFLGIFIDASNIMMNYFVSSLATESIFVLRMRSLYEVMTTSLSNTPWTSFTGAIITPIAMSVIFTIFNSFVGIVYSLYGIVFAMRYVVIWLLVIISPFGFFCYILPATRGFFKQWWRWFIGWCVVGVTGSFFLYLGEIMFQFIDQAKLVPLVTEHQGMEIGVFTQLFPLTIPLLFIAFGFFVTMAISFSGSKGIVDIFQKTSSSARKSFSQLPGTTAKEKAASASVAIKNAFQVPMSSPSFSNNSKETGNKNSAPSLNRETHSLYKRQMTGGEERRSMDTGLTNNSISQVTSFASQGIEEATLNIANQIEEKEQWRTSADGIKQTNTNNVASQLEKRSFEKGINPNIPPEKINNTLEKKPDKDEARKIMMGRLKEKESFDKNIRRSENNFN